MRRLASAFTALALAAGCAASGDGSREYAATQERLCRGWNTWNTNSVFSQVLLPEGLSVTVGLHSLSLFGGRYLSLAQPGGTAKDGPRVAPGLHALDGDYTDLTVEWMGMRVRIQSAHSGGDLLLLVTPLEVPAFAPIADFEVGMLWNRPGGVGIEGGVITAGLPSRRVRVFGAGIPAADLSIPASTPFLSYSLAGEAGVSTGRARSLEEIRRGMAAARGRLEAGLARPGVSPETVGAVEAALGWDTIYDPLHARVISPVSRSWSVGWGGYVLFDWDTFFAGSIAGLFGRDLAYANLVEMLREETPGGFVPNYAGARISSLDRSEPPVGSIVVLDTYRRFRDRWLLEAAFGPLLRWNRWWDERRQVDGYLAWGSDPTGTDYDRQDGAVNTLQGAKYESGLDNSPMYDGATFDAATHRMQMADVGLMSLYVADCDALSGIARVLGRGAEAAELTARSARYRSRLATLWSPGRHLYLNRDLRTGMPSPRVSPTNFYPLLAGVPTAEQARQMVDEHLMNPDEFWGEWVLPSVPRSDPAFGDQQYWRGRVWGPMNFLVYLGLRRYDLPGARAALARRSEALLMRDWRARGHIHENYNASTGEGDDVTSSDPFYHWGALLGAMEMLENEPPRGD